jgi:hypothetical protein
LTIKHFVNVSAPNYISNFLRNGQREEKEFKRMACSKPTLLFSNHNKWALNLHLVISGMTGTWIGGRTVRAASS